ncbi:MAG: hypothetical protein M3460_17305 [Actinomycetota bacterium]|nr:hypothetical protein [Actinomycetota bacterium]
MGREAPRASTQQHNQSRDGQARATTDEDRRAVRRGQWVQAAVAAGYADQPTRRGGAA